MLHAITLVQMGTQTNQGKNMKLKGILILVGLFLSMGAASSANAMGMLYFNPNASNQRGLIQFKTGRPLLQQRVANVARIGNTNGLETQTTHIARMAPTQSSVLDLNTTGAMQALVDNVITHHLAGDRDAELNALTALNEALVVGGEALVNQIDAALYESLAPLYEATGREAVVAHQRTLQAALNIQVLVADLKTGTASQQETLWQDHAGRVNSLISGMADSALRYDAEQDNYDTESLSAAVWN